MAGCGYITYDAESVVDTVRHSGRPVAPGTITGAIETLVRAASPLVSLQRGTAQKQPIQGLCEEYIRQCLLVLIRTWRIYDSAYIRSLMLKKGPDGIGLFTRLVNFDKSMNGISPRVYGHGDVVREACKYAQKQGGAMNV
jgi:hypothetical protein